MFEKISKVGRTGYYLENMKPFKERIDNVITLILEKSVYKDDYKVMLDTINKQDEKLVNNIDHNGNLRNDSEMEM